VYEAGPHDWEVARADNPLTLTFIWAERLIAQEVVIESLSRNGQLTE
jgi:hypothetical protein